MYDGEKKTIFKIIILTVFWISCDFQNVEAASLKGAVKAGNGLYQKGDYAASREKYQQALEKSPESDVINFNLGTTLYKEEDYEHAAEHLQKALLSEEEGLKEKAYYNLGNTLYKAGAAVADHDPAAAVSSLEKALTQYERALSIDQKDKDAKQNYAFVRKELEQLKERQRQQQDNQSKNKDQQRQNQPSSQKQDQKDQPQQNQKEDQSQQGPKEQPSEDEKDPSSQPQDQDEKQDQEDGQPEGGGYNNQQSSGAIPKGQPITQEEAQRILENYQQGEEPKGMLNFYPKKQEAAPVLKDW